MFTCLLKIHWYVPLQKYSKITVLEYFEGTINIDAIKRRTKRVCVAINVCIEILFLYKIKINLISIVTF